MWQKRWSMIEPYLVGSRLLDVGAGIGTFMHLAASSGWSVAGTEVSRSAIDLARSRYGLDIFEGELQQFPKAAKFHVITLWHVLEHVPSPAATLQLCRDLLESGGHLVIAVPNDSDARWALAKVKRSSGPYTPTMPGQEIHLSHFQPHVLARALSSRGFEVMLLTVDDQYPVPTTLTDMRVRGYRALMSLTGANIGKATLLIARRIE
jgi:SAM-dependent methyltransferase